VTGEYRWPGGSKTVIAAISPATGGISILDCTSVASLLICALHNHEA